MLYIGKEVQHTPIQQFRCNEIYAVKKYRVPHPREGVYGVHCVPTRDDQVTRCTGYFSYFLRTVLSTPCASFPLYLDSPLVTPIIGYSFPARCTMQQWLSKGNPGSPPFLRNWP